jgi:hypothetical protein
MSGMPMGFCACAIEAKQERKKMNTGFISNQSKSNVRGKSMKNISTVFPGLFAGIFPFKFFF